MLSLLSLLISLLISLIKLIKLIIKLIKLIIQSLIRLIKLIELIKLVKRKVSKTQFFLSTYLLGWHKIKLSNRVGVPEGGSIISCLSQRFLVVAVSYVSAYNSCDLSSLRASLHSFFFFISFSVSLAACRLRARAPRVARV